MDIVPKQSWTGSLGQSTQRVKLLLLPLLSRIHPRHRIGMTRHVASPMTHLVPQEQCALEEMARNSTNKCLFKNFFLSPAPRADFSPEPPEFMVLARQISQQQRNPCPVFPVPVNVCLPLVASRKKITYVRRNPGIQTNKCGSSGVFV